MSYALLQRMRATFKVFKNFTIKHSKFLKTLQIKDSKFLKISKVFKNIQSF
jgi:hypothetical protein